MHRPLLLLTLVTAALHAGMPSVTLTDVGRFRLESLSFFLVLLLLLLKSEKRGHASAGINRHEGADERAVR